MDPKLLQQKIPVWKSPVTNKKLVRHSRIRKAAYRREYETFFLFNYIATVAEEKSSYLHYGVV